MKINKTLILVILFSALSIILFISSSSSSITELINAQENKITNSNNKNPKFLAIQHAQSGSISVINNTFTLSLSNESNKTIFSSNTSRNLSLELNNVSDKTILFSDKPDRIFKTVSTHDFIGNWSIGMDNYEVNSPNAILIVDDGTKKQGIAIVELFNPIYYANNKMLKYNIFSNNTTSIDLPNEFGKSTLVIDEVG
jgi:hypothetical protein